MIDRLQRLWIARIASRLPLRYSIGQLLIITALIGAAIFWWTNGVMHIGREFDVAIVGDGFFQVCDENVGSPTRGQIFYTREGHMVLGSYGQLCLALDNKLWTLYPPNGLPIDATGMTIEPRGNVLCHHGDKRQQCSQIQLVDFPARGYIALPGRTGMFQVDPCAGVLAPAQRLFQNNPGLGGMGLLRQGYIGTVWQRFIPPATALLIA
jgi:flagellar basal body rod protein FlgG